MSLNSVQQVQDAPKSGGGGLWGTIGSIVGLGAGAALAPFTGGASLAGGAALAGAGAGLGGLVGSTVGNVADPGSGGSVSDVIPNQPEGTPLRTMASAHPEVQLAQLSDASKALSESTLPAPQANQYAAHISNAQTVLRQRLGIGT